MIKEADEVTIRKYLLGELAEEEQARLVESLMTDDDLFKLLEVIEDELIDDCVNGELSGEEQKRFDTYFLSTPERREKFIFAQTLREYVSSPSWKPDPIPVWVDETLREYVSSARAAESKPAKVHRPVWWRKPFSIPYLGLAAAAIIILGLMLGMWRTFFHQPSDNKAIAALKSAYRDERPTESRITGFDYAQPPPITRGGGQEKFDYVARDHARALIYDEVKEHPDAQSYHDLGRLYLAEHEFDKAIEQFEKALKLDEKNAQIESDLGAALMEKGKADRLKDEPGKSAEDFASAHEHLTKALELNGSLLEALFNRALCRQEMKLYQRAEEDWRAYLEKDANSKWAEEARRNLKALEERKDKSSQNRELFQDFLDSYQIRDRQKSWRAFSQSRARTGNLIVERLLDDYLDSMAQGRDKEADEKLQMLSFAGEVESENAGDNFTLDLARCYKLATPGQRDAIAQARKWMKAASSSFNKSEFAPAIAPYSKAKRLFDQANDDCEAAFAESWIGNCYLRIPDTERSLSIFKQLSETCERKNYRWLLAQSLNAISDAQYSVDALSKTLEYADRSLKVSEQIQDPGCMMRNLQQFVSVHLKFRNYRESLQFSMRAFDLARTFAPDPKQIWPFYYETAFDLYWLGFFKSALEFEREALHLALESKWPSIISRSYTRLGLIYEKLQDYDEAIRNGELALEQGERIESQSSKQNITGNAALRLGHLYRQAGDLNKAIESYDQAIRSYEDLKFRIYHYEAHKGKLLAFIGLGNDSAAKEELSTAINLFEQYRAKIWEESNRNSFFDDEQSIYDIAAGFAYSRMNDPRKAFDYSETSRARSLLDLTRTGAQVVDGKEGPNIKLGPVTEPLPLSEIQRRMPDQSQILQYAALDDRLLIWVISKNKVDSKEEKVTSDELSRKVSRPLRVVA